MRFRCWSPPGILDLPRFLAVKSPVPLLHRIRETSLVPRRTLIGPLKPISSVILDLDGVLFEGTNQAYIDCHRHALTSVDVDVPERELRRRLLEYWGHPHEFELALFVEDRAKHAAACKAYEEFLFSDAFTERITEISGARQAIQRMADAGITLAVASGMHHRQIPAALVRIGIDPKVFAVCLSAYQLPNDELQKPHPYMLKEILSELSLAPQHSLYVGDSPSDIRMAKAAEVLAVAVLTGNMSRKDAEVERADLIVKSIGDLVDVLPAP
jgi:phosphoglycolate phosphatase-like HAD superfamily hydrolase